MAERNLELIAALGDAPRDRIFHEPGDAVLTRRVFTEPVERLLHVNGLAQLERLDWTGTHHVTGAGVKELQTALPNCKISY